MSTNSTSDAELLELFRVTRGEAARTAGVGGFVRAEVAGLRAVAERVWMEGFDAGERDVWEHDHTKGWDAKCTPNPYSQNALVVAPPDQD